MILLPILHFCFKGLLGLWVPAFVERLSNNRQRLLDELKPLASNLCVINISQDLGLLSPYELVSTKQLL